MTIYWIAAVSLLSGGVLGYFLSTYLIARDPDVVRLSKDEVVVKKPEEGLVLVAVSPEVMRRLVQKKNSDGSSEARDLYRG